MEPINYSRDVLSPIEGYLQGIKFGEGLNTDRLNQQATQQNMGIQREQMDLQQAQFAAEQQAAAQASALAAQQRAAAEAEQAAQRKQAEAGSAALTSYLGALENGTATPADLRAGMAAFPQLADQFQAFASSVSEERLGNEIGFGKQLSFALANDNTDAAANLLRTRQQAAEASGDERAAAGYKAQLLMLESNPKGLLMQTLMPLASQLPSDEFDTFHNETLGLGGGSSAPAGYEELRLRARDAGLVEGTQEFQDFMRTGGGEPATFRALDMQARAAGYIPGSPDYAEFMATRGAGEQARARTTETNLADIETGGDAARVKAAGAAEGAREVVAGSELSEMQRNMPGLLEVVGQLDELAGTATYTAAGRVSDETRKQFGLEPSESAIARAEYIAVVDNQVLPLLRQTFGAAFTAKEGETLRATLGDPDKSPAEKRAVLRAFIAQKERDLISRGGTMPTKAETSTPPADDAEFLRSLGLEP